MGSLWNSAAGTATLLLAPPYREVVLQTKGGHQIVLDDAPGTGGITLRTATGQIIVLAGTGAEISDGAGGSVKLMAPRRRPATTRRSESRAAFDASVRSCRR